MVARGEGRQFVCGEVGHGRALGRRPRLRVVDFDAKHSVVEVDALLALPAARVEDAQQLHDAPGQPRLLP